MYRLKDIKIRENISDEEVLDKALKKANISKDRINSWRIFRKSIDARNKSDVHFVYTIDIECDDIDTVSELTKVQEVNLPEIVNNRKSEARPVVIGAGPAGLFAALVLAEKRG